MSRFNRCTPGFLILLIPLVAGGGRPIFSQASATDAAPRFTKSQHDEAVVQNFPRRLIRNLDEHGAAFQSGMIYDLTYDPIGSKGRGEWIGRYSLDLSLTLDGEKALGWKGAKGFVHVKHHLNEFGNRFEGVAQGYSNIDADSRTTLYELWVERRFSSHEFRVKAGKFDANTEFATVQSAADFLNSSMGYSPTILNFATYPEPEPGVEFSSDLPRNSQVSFGFLIAPEKRKMALAELMHRWTFRDEEFAGRASMGIWHLSRGPAINNGTRSTGTEGIYAVLEQTLWRRPNLVRSRSRQAVSAFAQFGTGKARENPYLSHLGLGANIANPFGARPLDGAGVAATWVHLGPKFGCGQPKCVEWVVEAYYKFAFGGHFAFVPDVQVFQHPGGSGSAPTYALVTERLSVFF